MEQNSNSSESAIIILHCSQQLHHEKFLLALVEQYSPQAYKHLCTTYSSTMSQSLLAETTEM